MYSYRTFLLAFTLASSVAFGQLDSNSVTVTASRSGSNPQADQILFGIFVDTGLDSSLTDVVALLQGAGITAANFSNVSTMQGVVPGSVTSPRGEVQLGPILEWTFGLPVSMARMKDTVSQLNTLQQSIAKNGSAIMSFQVQGTQVSPQLQQQSQSCSVSDLLTDARAQAQKLADAGAMNLGVILAMSSVTPNAPSIPSAVIGRYSSTGSYYSTPCSLTVKFGVSRY